MKAWLLVAALCLVPALAWGQAVPENLPAKYGTRSVQNPSASCTGESKSCTDWCDKNNPMSNTCKQESTWRVDYCKRTGLYPVESRPNVWVGNRE